jgi:hypothetical protein
LEEERKSFTQAALKIGKERAQLQRDMEEFQEEKRLFDNEKVLQLIEEDNSFVEMATFGTPLQPIGNRMTKTPVKSALKTPKKEVTIKSTPSSVRFYSGMYNKEN